MTGRPIEALFAALGPYEHGWRADIPTSEGAFFGHPVALAFETWSTPGEGLPPRPSPAELALARLILGHLRAVLDRAQEAFAASPLWVANGGPAGTTNPHLWISRERLEEGDLWGLVVEWRIADGEGRYPLWFADFRGLDLLRVWSDRGPYPPSRLTSPVGPADAGSALNPADG